MESSKMSQDELIQQALISSDEIGDLLEEMGASTSNRSPKYCMRLRARMAYLADVLRIVLRNQDMLNGFDSKQAVHGDREKRITNVIRELAGRRREIRKARQVPEHTVTNR